MAQAPMCLVLFTLLWSAPVHSSESLMTHQRGIDASLGTAEGRAPHLVAGEFEGRMALAMTRVCNQAGRCREVPSAEMLTSGGSDVYLAKFDSQDNLLWATQVGGAGTDKVGALAASGYTGFNHMRRSAGEPAHPLKVPAAGASLSEQPAFLAGVIQGTAKAGRGVTIDAASSMSTAPFVSKYNVSDGSLLWARAMGLCGANRSYHVYNAMDPRAVHADTFGVCTVDAASTDGNGDVVVAGSVFGWLQFPRLVNFTFLPREYYGTIHAKELDSSLVPDPVEEAVGFPSFQEAFPGLGTESFLLEVEAAETGASLRNKLSEKLRVPAEWVNLLVNDGVEPQRLLQPGEVGYTSSEEFKPKPYDKRWNLGSEDSVGPEVVSSKYLRVQFCNVTWVSNMTLYNKSTCPIELDPTGQPVVRCPTDCSKNSDCVAESFCENRVCTIARTMCANLTTAVVHTSLESEVNCTHRSSTGRACIREPWLAKFDKDGLFQWASLRKHVNTSLPRDYDEYLTYAKQQLHVERVLEVVPTDYQQSMYEMAYWAREADELGLGADHMEQTSYTGF